MRYITIIITMLLAGIAAFSLKLLETDPVPLSFFKNKNKTSIFDFKAMSGGKDFDLGQFRGEAMLIVNTASKCGFTTDGLNVSQTLHELYRKKDGQKKHDQNKKSLVVIGFPCDQFAGQEFDTNSEVQEFCSAAKVTFPIMDKVDVNGENASEIFQFLKASTPIDILGIAKLQRRILWNFESFFLVPDRPVARFTSLAFKTGALEEAVAEYFETD